MSLKYVQPLKKNWWVLLYMFLYINIYNPLNSGSFARRKLLIINSNFQKDIDLALYQLVHSWYTKWCKSANKWHGILCLHLLRFADAMVHTKRVNCFDFFSPKMYIRSRFWDSFIRLSYTDSQQPASAITVFYWWD